MAASSICIHLSYICPIDHPSRWRVVKKGDVKEIPDDCIVEFIHAIMQQRTMDVWWVHAINEEVYSGPDPTAG